MLFRSDEFEEQRLKGNATKRDLSKLRDEMAIQHYATFKRVVEINEKTSEIASHNQKNEDHPRTSE